MEGQAGAQVENLQGRPHHLEWNLTPGRTQSQGQRDPGWRDTVLGSWVELCDPYWATFNLGHIPFVSTHMNDFIHFFKS